jgi:hypothetical protein
MFNFLFNPLSLEKAFELLIENTLLPGDLKRVSRKINRLSDDDWRLWFGRFLLHLRSNSETNNFADAYICLEIALETLKADNNPVEVQKFLSLINNPSLFLAYKFYYDSTGATAPALLLSRAYQNGWGVARDLEKAFEFAKLATQNNGDELYPAAQDIFNSFLINPEEYEQNELDELEEAEED